MYAPHVLPAARDYAAMVRSFRWQVPARYNIGVDVCDRWAEREPGRAAILDVRADGGVDEISYGALRDTSNRLANVLAAHGIGAGDRVAILLPQAPEVAAAHIAIYKLGAIALPLAMLFGVDAIGYRLAEFRRHGADHQRAGARQARAGRRRCGPARSWSCRSTGRRDGALGFDDTLARASSDFTRARHLGRRSGADDLHLRHHRLSPRARCMPIACCSVICRASRCRTSSCRSRATGSGRRPTGPGPAACSTCLLPEPALRRAGGGARGSTSSIPRRPSR